MITKGTEVGWSWLGSVTTGVVLEVHHERCEIESKGKLIVRNGTHNDPALVIKHANGALVLKLAHEVQVLKKQA